MTARTVWLQSHTHMVPSGAKATWSEGGGGLARDREEGEGDRMGAAPSLFKNSPHMILVHCFGDQNFFDCKYMFCVLARKTRHRIFEGIILLWYRYVHYTASTITYSHFFMTNKTDSIRPVNFLTFQ